MYLTILRNSRIFNGLTDEDFSRLCSCVNRRAENFEKKQVLVRQGDLVYEIGVLIKGGLLSEKYHMDGRMQIVRTFFPPSVVNLEAASSSLKTSPVSITANRNGCIVWLPFDALFKGDILPETVRKKQIDNLLSMLADESIRMMYKSDILAVRSVRGRIMAYLSVISERRGSLTVNIGMNQEELAQYLCVDRSSLSFELNKMRKEGILDFRKKTYTLMFH